MSLFKARLRALPVTLLAVAAAIPVSAQTSRRAPAVEPPLAQFLARAVSNEKWPQALVTAAEDAYVTVLAITPGVNRFAVQVLSPSAPRDNGFIRPRHPEQLRYFSPDAIGHRVARGASMAPPIIVGITSSVRPDLSSFAQGNSWRDDLVINVPIDSTTDLVDVVAQVIFRGDSVRVGVVQMPANLSGVSRASGPAYGSGAPSPEAPSSRYLGSDCYNPNKSARGICIGFDDRPGAFRWLVPNDQNGAAPTVPTPVPPPAPPKPPAPN